MKINYTKNFKELVEQKGCVLLSEYINNKTNVEIKCDKGHIYTVTPTHFKSGRGCPKCSGKCTIQAKEQFIRTLNQEGYELLSEYVNTKIKVKLKCPEGHKYITTSHNFKRGNRCPKCNNKCSIQAKEQFIELLVKEGYELLSEYKTNNIKIKLRCPKGHIYNVKPNTFKSMNSRCPKCSNMCPEQAKEQFKELLESEGYELLSDYKDTMSKVKLRCDKGHEYSVKPNDLKNGHRCPKCSNKCPIQAKELFLELLAKEGYELLSEYTGALKKVKLKCPEGHEYSVTPSSFKSYRRCPHCIGSTGQRLLQEMLEIRDLGKVIYNDRKILNGLELDIYYPELSIGIEYQGNYWHSLPENIERDKRKKLLCKEKCIKLIEVWDNDFMKNPKIIEEKIYNEIIELMNL